MNLTPAQLATLKTDIANNTATVTYQGAPTAINTLPNNDDANIAIAGWYNLNANPSFWAWKTSVTKNTLVTSVGPEGTTFNWTGNGFITRSAGEQAAWAEIFNGTGTVNPSLANVRQAFSDIFSGTGNAAANRTHLLAVARRLTTNAEKLFASGTGSTASPATMSTTAEGNLSYQEVSTARNLP
jgi:hypothetical protein